MRKTTLSFVSLALAALFTAMFGIASCAQPTSPKDCQIINGSMVCKPS